MDAKKFLIEKGILLDEKYKYVIGTDKGNWDLSNLLEEYATIKAHDIMIMKNK
jgi:hypothetical protein